jgi:hypothetical protein
MKSSATSSSDPQWQCALQSKPGPVPGLCIEGDRNVTRHAYPLRRIKPIHCLNRKDDVIRDIIL